MSIERLTRRELIAAIAAGASLAAPVFARAKRRGMGASRPPNVLFILADDLGAGDLSCYGRPDYRTGNIDRLCGQGVKLTQAYANSASCSPTRVALATGRYQNRLAVGNYDPLPAGKKLGLPVGHPTLASLLTDAGYVTGLIGKWHIGELPEHGPNAMGYAEFFGLLGSHIDYYTHTYNHFGPSHGPPVHDLHEIDASVNQDGYATTLFTERAVRFIEQHRARPFLLSLHYTAPHWPWQSPRDRGGPRQTDFHFEGGSREMFAEMVASLDEGVGRVLSALARAGLERDTLVVFTSDNGGERFSYHWPLRGAKTDLWEGGIRVPAIVRWPKRIRAGASSAQLVMTMDWLPTIVAAAGARAATSHPPDGVDVLPAIAGERPTFERTVFWRTQRSQAARSGSWKYLAERGHEYLYDLSRDEMERANLKLQEPHVLSELRREYELWNQGMAPIPEDARRPRDFLEPLEAMEPLRPSA